MYFSYVDDIQHGEKGGDSIWCYQSTPVKIGLTAKSAAIFQAVCDVCDNVGHAEIEFGIDSVMLRVVLCVIWWVTLLHSGSLLPSQSCTCHITPPTSQAGRAKSAQT